MDEVTLREVFKNASDAGWSAGEEVDRDACLTEIIRRGGDRWIAFIQDQIKEAMSAPEDDVPRRYEAAAYPLELLTALRRMQGKPDPLHVIVAKASLICVSPDYPVFEVKLTSRDEEKRTLGFLDGCDYRSGRRTRFSLEVRDAEGKPLPVREPFWGMGGGLGAFENLKFGESVDYLVPMVDYVYVPRPGKYTVRVLYAKATIADEGHTHGYIVYRSAPVCVKFVMPDVRRDQAIDKDVRALLAQLPEKGDLLVVDGPYGPWLHYQISPESVVGRLLSIGWQAVPTMVEQLDQPKLSVHRRGWLLSLLFSITGYNDPREPDRSLFGNDLLPRYRYWTTRPCHGGMAFGAQPGNRVRGSGSGGPFPHRIDEAKQKAFAARWQAWRTILAGPE